MNSIHAHNLFSQVSQCHKMISIIKTVTFMRAIPPPSHLWGLNVLPSKWWDEHIERISGDKKETFWHQHQKRWFKVINGFVPNRKFCGCVCKYNYILCIVFDIDASLLVIHWNKSNEMPQTIRHCFSGHPLMLFQMVCSVLLTVLHHMQYVYRRCKCHWRGEVDGTF